MQNSAEVIDSLFRAKKAERVGVQELIWDDTLRKWCDEGYPTSDDGKPVDSADHFDLDMHSAGGWFDALPVRGYEEIIDETDEWEIKENGAGAHLKWWKNKSGTPEHIAFKMTTREIWERDYRPHLLELDPERVDLDEAKKLLEAKRAQGRWAYYAHLFIWENMRRSMGDITLYESLLLDPDWIHDYGRVYTDFFQAHYRLLFEEAGLPDGVWMCEDLGYRNGLFCSPEVLKELIFPYYREMVDFFHSYDVPVMLHSCGNITEAMDLIVDAGFDALHPMERKAGCDPLAFAQEYGDRLAFVGGLDVRVLESGDRELIRREVGDLVDGMKKRGARYVFSSDHSISTNVAYADYKYALEVYRDHMMY
ncbi:MAG: uroporphyrinogen decarboxylase family protein [Planctomycetota bacterium]|jgi:uroporphyrinogen decarboxylase